MQARIRNFCIIAHIDHGKSTLADRLLEMTQTVDKRHMQAQLLDSNPIERERGITIKLAPVRMMYRPKNIFFERSAEGGESRSFIKEGSRLRSNNSEYILNLIDTPGHVDFNYEVSRSLAACEGAVLVVDATQGVQAQTLANLNLARKQNLTIIPVINKIDLPNAQVEQVAQQLEDLGFKKTDIISISAKSGKNIDQVLKAIIERIPSPQGLPESPLRALVFSSQYDAHKGVVVYVRIVDGSYEYKPDNNLNFMFSHASTVPLEIGYFTPALKSAPRLEAGEVGYIATGLKEVALAKVGDTVTVGDELKVEPLPGYKEPQSMVFLGLFPIQTDEINQVRDALGKLHLSDSAFNFRPISSLALGNGFHCGFLGLLHAEVVQERLQREFNLSLLATAPSVEYALKLKSSVALLKTDANGLAHIQSATEFPDPSLIEQSYEPVMNLTIFAPKRYVGAIMQLAQDKRAEFVNLEYVGMVGDKEGLAKFSYLMPLAEMIVDFFDLLKSATEGYASLDYDFFDFVPVELVKLDILLNHEKVDAFSQLVVASRATYLGKNLVEKLSQVIPRHQFSVPVQAAIGGQIIARADIKAFRKDVIQKLYGGDRTRKDKLLEAQKKGKKKMKLVGQVEIPQSAFLQVFKRG